MIAIDLNGTIKTFSKLPKVWSDENGTHLNITNGEAFGFYSVVVPTLDSRIEELSPIYFSNNIFTYDVIEVPIKETLAELKEAKVAELKLMVGRKLSETDWYIIREADTGVVTSQDIKNAREALRTQSNTIEAEINALSTKKAVVLFDINI
jgi:hypothetical protein